MVIWLVMVTVPPMIWPFTPPALLLPKSTLQGLYTNNFMLSLKFVLFDTEMSYGDGLVQLRPFLHTSIMKSVHVPPTEFQVVWFVVEIEPSVTMARFPCKLTTELFPHEMRQAGLIRTT